MTMSRRWIFRELLTLGAVITLTFAARSAFADHYYVPSGSMEFTLVAGDRVLVDKTAYGIRLPFTGIEVVERRGPARGEVVVFDSPEDGTRLIKRVVAVGGDRVALRDGKLIINGEPLADPATPDIEVFGDRRVPLNLADGGGPGISGMVVPEQMVLVLGDHRGVSRDGRAFGLIPVDAIYARAMAIYYRRGEGLTWEPL